MKTCINCGTENEVTYGKQSENICYSCALELSRQQSALGCKLKMSGIGDRTNINLDLSAVVVPGGWLFEHWNQGEITHVTFVPAQIVDKR